jgi:Cys-tRNA(Pro)/Cys-tRNA(Cys) deacylase
MTPAIAQLNSAGVDFELHEFESSQSRGDGAEAARALGVPAERVFKTLVVEIDAERLVVAVLPVNRELDLKLLAAAVHGKRAAIASAREAERATGYVLGGISPLGQRRALATVLDASALEHPTIFVSGGRRGLELELSGPDLRSLCHAKSASIARAGSST